MKTASTELIALLESGSFKLADLYTITLKNGDILRYTNSDIPIQYGGNPFYPIAIERTKIKVVIGIEVDTLNITISPTDETVGGNPMIGSVHSGAFDGALIKLERAYMDSWGNTSPGTIHLFEGEVAGVEMDGISIYLKAWSLLATLNIKMPINIYQSPCINSLYGTACGVNKASMAVSGSVTSGSTKNTINSALGQASGYFSLGTIEFETGPNSGVVRTVKSFASGQFTLVRPLFIAPTTGDTFKAYPGCNKTLSVCTNTFFNDSKFRGYPWIPVPETAY